MGTTSRRPPRSLYRASPPVSLSRNMARAAISEWGWFPTDTLKSARWYTSAGTFSAPTTISRSSSRGISGRASSTLRPYMVRWTTLPWKPRTLLLHDTPVSMVKSPPNLSTTLLTFSSSTGSSVSTNIPLAPRALELSATWVVTLLSLSGRWPILIIQIPAISLVVDELYPVPAVVHLHGPADEALEHGG